MELKDHIQNPSQRTKYDDVGAPDLKLASIRQGRVEPEEGVASTFHDHYKETMRQEHWLLLEDWGSILSTHMAALAIFNSSPKDLTPSFGLCGHCTLVVQRKDIKAERHYKITIINNKRNDKPWPRWYESCRERLMKPETSIRRGKQT